MQLHKHLVTIFCLVLSLTGCALTEMGRGVDLLKNNEYAKALPHFEKAAQEGNKRAAVTAGWLHLIEDRKSTRLNSSHVKISYAVFCLKKKKKKKKTVK